MATGEQPRDAHADGASLDDDDEAPPEAHLREEPPPPENGSVSAAHEAPEAEPNNKQRGRLEGFIPDIVKRTFYAGLGAVFTTEEGIRKIASDLKLPKDVA